MTEDDPVGTRSGAPAGEPRRVPHRAAAQHARRETPRARREPQHARREPKDDARRAAALVVASVVARRPWLLPVAVGETLRMATPGWWRRWPPVPMPDPALWRFRIETAYGGAGDAVPCGRDVRAFLEWCREAHDWRAG